jgi:UDP-3-O-[3-hydroxymyristoyl] glucosamine N-acyltransferase
VTVGDYAVFGGKAGVVDHVTIGERAQVGAGSVVTKSVAPGVVVWGFPARPIRQAKRDMASGHRLSTIAKRTLSLVTRVRSLEERIARLEERAESSTL